MPAASLSAPPVEDLFDKPLHPYTEGLLHSVPKLHGDVDRLTTIPGSVPNPARFPSGCKFHPRCPRTRMLAQNAPPEQTIEVVSGGERFRVLKRCQAEEPQPRELMPKHWAACHQIAGYDGAPATVPRLSDKRQVVPQTINADEIAAVDATSEVAK